MVEISIIMPTLNEENYIEIALQSIKEQCFVKNNCSLVEIILADSGSIDDTVDISRQYVDKVINVPKGKLTARNIATSQATGDIIVSVDADCYYPERWLYELLKPFRQSNVIAVRGRTVHYDESFKWNKLWTLLEDIDMNILHRNRMLGRNSAYYKNAFYNVGAFDETIDQQDVFAMMQEEEIGFGTRLSKVGKVVYQEKAECYHTHLGKDKIMCRALTKIPGYNGQCNNYGVGTERF